jgi:transposase-like protein
MRKINLESRKGKIEELYWNEKLSLVKIAKEIGVSAGLIRKNMVLWGIDRRATRKRELIKPTKEELEKDYYDKEKSVKDILKQFDVGMVTLFRWLKEYKINPSRRWKYNKTSFSGDEKEKAYILGLVAGDIHARKHSKQILAELTSTHPAMVDLFFNIFSKYGTPKKYIKHNKKIEKNEWRAYVLLDKSFEFMLSEDYNIEKNFYDFLAGFFDCEGCFFVYKNNGGNIGISFLVYNSDKELLERIKQRLERDKFHPKLRKYHKAGREIKGGYVSNIDLWAIALYQKEEVIQLMNILPIKHREKIDKFEIIKSMKNWKWETISDKLANFKSKIKLEVQEFVKNPVKNERSTVLQEN